MDSERGHPSRTTSNDHAVTRYAKQPCKRTALASAIALTLAPCMAAAVDIIAPDILTVDQNYNIQSGVNVSGDNGQNSAILIYIDSAAPYNSTLNNAGRIEYLGTAPGYALNVISALGGGLVNSGSIIVEFDNAVSAEATAIFLPGGVLSTGTLLNEGTIASTASSAGGSASALGVYVLGMNGASSNSATGSISAFASGQSGQAYGFFAVNSIGGFANAGALTAEALGTSAGAYGFFSVNSSGNFANTGSVAALATGTSSAEAYGLFIVSSSGNFTSTGSLLAEASGDSSADAYGLFTVSSTGNFGVDGPITAAAVASSNATAYGLFSVASTGSFSTNGSIEATASGSAAQAYALFSVSSTGSFDNTGTLTAHATGASAEAYGAYVVSFAGDIINTGTVTAAAEGSGATAYGAFLVGFDGTVENLGSISATAADGGVGLTSAYSLWALGNGGILNNRAGAKLAGKLEIHGAGNSVHNAGLIHLPQNTGSAADNQSYIAGDYQQTATGKLKTDAYGVTGGEYSTLLVSGDVTLDSGATAAVNVRAGNTGITRLAIGEKLSAVVTAQGTLTGNFSKITDNSALFSFTPVAYQGAGGTIDFEIIEGVTAVQSALAAGNTMALGAAAVFDEIIATEPVSGDMQNVLNALGSLETGQEVSDALSQTLPLVSTSQATGNVLRGIAQVIRERQGSLQGRSSGEGFYGDERLWLKAFGSWAEQDGRKGISGYDADTSGLVLGSDAALSAVSRLGVAFAYARTDIDDGSNVVQQSAEVDSYQAMLYGSYNLNDATELDYQLDIARHNNDAQRDIDFGGLNRQAKSDYSSWSAHIGAALSHSLQWTEQTRFIPALRADYTWMRSEGYSEKGAGALNLDVDSDRTEAFVVGVDGQLDHDLSDRLRLSAKVGLGYDLINDRTSITSAFAGAPAASFTTEGIDQSPWIKVAGLSMSYQANEQTLISAAYDLEGREDFTNQTASVKVRWAF